VAFDPPIDAGGLDWGFWYRAGPPLEAAPLSAAPPDSRHVSNVSVEAQCALQPYVEHHAL